jgi:hypothetical protein
MSPQDQPQPSGAHLVGSVPLDSTDDVFRYACKTLPGYLRRIPDGETGERFNFVDWQRSLFPGKVAPPFGSPPKEVPIDEVEATVASLPTIHTGYDDAAMSSYAVFRKLKDEGVIPAHVLFQVSLPTVVSTLVCIEFSYRAAVEPLYEEALLRALARIQAEIPAHDLAIQWDVAPDIGIIEGVPFLRPWFIPVHEGIVQRIVRLADKVNDDVEMGFHLCYGDYEHRHWMEPRDTGTMVDLATALLRRVKHPVRWFHMPVPKSRDDVAYFAPLQKLVDPLEQGPTELYLGLVHPNDEEGTKRRIRAVGEAGIGMTFGVATECGMGRTPASELDSIFGIMKGVSQPVS